MAASLTDILASLQNGVQALNRLTAVLGGSATALSYYGFSAITSSPTTIVVGSTGETYPTELAFHNPGSIDILVYPSVDGNGNTLTPTSASPGGAIKVLASGGTVVIDGGSTTAWLAISTGTGAVTVTHNA